MFPEYYFSEDGEVYSEKRNKLISQSVNHIGYLTVTITDKNGYRAPRKVHRLVYQAFMKKELSQSETIDHIDNNRLNNNISNLQLLSMRDNSRKGNIDKINNKLIFTNQNIEIICQMMEKQINPKTIFARVGINYGEHSYECDQLLKGLSNNKTVFPEITSKYDIKDYKYNDNSTRNDGKLTEDDVANIYMRLIMGEQNKSNIAREYNISLTAVSKIGDKQIWKKLTDEIDEEYFELPNQSEEIENYTNPSDKDVEKISEDNTLTLKSEIDQALGC